MKPTPLELLRLAPKSTRDECTITAWYAGRADILKENERLRERLNKINEYVRGIK